ncbi:MAG: DJ-1/PfpI family protein [Aquificaceae bacterium]|nr:DJ-1/PfpI family protein [Aquificaceae bacterium]MCS7307620.1 DJ-1/PfpI family protein [Aquificaceae bacterium]MCX8075984.1 DJ-1/PfpI family protein [Aquificaceae bacterium]MDW8095844.1 DJ-1/PfpI family protein [Aquificaceae bacterium]MDW8433811.1 DJ-1/PfpI family protein [Aquificaceae bacterium]
MRRVAIILAEGFEEVEAVAPIDVLRRAGVEVVIAGLTPDPVPSARNVKIVPDTTVDSLNSEELDLIILPGGAGGVEKLKQDPRVEKLVKAMEEKKKLIGAICAAPTALAKFGVLQGRKATVYPSLIEDIKPAQFVDSPVVEDQNIVTSQGPGTALLFGLKLAERLVGKDKAQEVAGRMLVEYG